MPSLIWKEWHEQSWKLGFGCLVLGTFAYLGLRDRLIPDNTMLMWVCFLGVTILPVLSSTGLLPAERAEGSFESLLALPVQPWRILLCKTLMGLLLCAGPMFIAAGLSLLVAGGREMSSANIISLYARSTGAMLSLFIWMLALTSRLPSEARGALLALGLLIFWTLATEGLAYPDVPRMAFALSPLAFIYDFGNERIEPPSIWIVVVVQAAIAFLLWLWTSARLTSVSEGKP